MALTINTNVVSLNAQRNLGLSGSQLGVSMQRLSSGLRVNSAKDDAAGLAIAERMNAQARGLAVAARNANDGISLAQTAEGALGKMGDMLQRMRELAVQASNATNSEDDRKALQAEVNQLRSEIDRVAKTTTFNGTKILDGSFSGGVFQVGAGAGDNITVGGITNAKSSALSSVEYRTRSVNVDPSTITQAGLAKVENLSIKYGSQTVALDDLGEASTGQERLGQVVAAINAKTADTGVTAFLKAKSDNTFDIELRSDSKEDVTFVGFTPAATGVGGPDSATTLTAPTYTFDSNTSDLNPIWNSMRNDLGGSLSALMTVSAVKDKYDEVVDQGVSFGRLDTLRTAITNAVSAYNSSVATINNYRAAFGDAGTPGSSNANYGTLNGSLQAANQVTPAGGSWAAATPEEIAQLKANAETQLGLKVLDLDISHKETSTGLDKLTVSSQEGAWLALKSIDSAIDQVNSARANLGALQTRFEKSIENIDIMNENISAARGRIVDADFASETASLSRTQILQQAGTAMVAQANQLPQQVLSLLQ